MSTANGTVTPEWRVDARVPMRIFDKAGETSVVKIVMRRAILMPQCAHTLLPGGALAKSHGLGFEVAPWTGDARINIANERIAPAGSHAPLINAGVLVLPGVESPKAKKVTFVRESDRLDANTGVTKGTKGNTYGMDYQTWHLSLIHI